MIRQLGTRKVPVGAIVVGKRWRKPRTGKIEEIRASLRENGLMSPIGVRSAGVAQSESSWVLVYGATRLAAAKLEGWTEIDAQILEGSSVDMEKAELVENLHRGELTKLQRDRQIARYIELCGEKRILRGPRAKKGRGRPESGVRAAARELKLAEATARDALKAAKMTEAAAALVVELGLADKPADYRAVAAEPTAEAQIAKAHELSARKQRGITSSGNRPGRSHLVRLLESWKAADTAAQHEFLLKIGHAACRRKNRSPLPQDKQLDIDGLQPRPSAARKEEKAASHALSLSPTVISK